MKRFATHFALLALAGTLAVPAFAAAPTGPGGPGSTAPNCSDPALAKTPACLHKRKPGMGAHPMGTTPMGNNPPSPMHHNPPPPGKTPPPPPPPGKTPQPPLGPKGPPGPGMPGMHPGHNGPPPGFQSFRHSYHFPHFAPPTFTVRPGISVPHHYHHWLRPLPPAFFGFYPMYRGFLFFVTPDGQIVIVDPRSFQIVAII
jgi:hypothetical protein